MLRSASRELPESPLQPFSCKSSFDCVIVRFADDNFAQNDRLTKGVPESAIAQLD
jgi:hypothetical protein